MKTIIKNCTVVNPSESPLPDQSIIIEDGIITDVLSGSQVGDVVIDAGGRYAIPGLIDVHVQGAGGSSVFDNDIPALEQISLCQARFGVTAFLATTEYRTDSENEHLATAAQSVEKTPLSGARCYGIHLEGPFISMEKKGMIHPLSITEPTPQTFEKILDLCQGHLSMMTVAPELEGADKVISALAEKGIVASFGHSMADYKETVKGIDLGITHATHLFNAMASIHHRQPGPFIALFENENVTVQLITDGVHVHEAVMRLVYRTFGPDRIAVITDGMQPMGLEDGIYVYNGVEYESSKGTARYMDGTLIGASLGQIEMMKRYMDFIGCSLGDAVLSGSYVPAQVLGLGDKKGSLEKSKDADIVLIDDDFGVFKTIVGGNTVFSTENS